MHPHTVRDGVRETRPGDSPGRSAGAPITFAAFGLVTPEKRVPQMLRALAAIRGTVPHVRLQLVGDVTPHYDVAADARAHGVDDLVEVTGWADDDAFDRAIAAADVCLCLRWPTNREASGPWLRALAAGKPTVINDLTHLVDLPTLDPRTWEVQVASPAAADAHRRWRREEAIAVAVDVLDEDHSLAIAMRRLALDRRAARRSRRRRPPSLGRRPHAGAHGRRLRAGDPGRRGRPGRRRWRSGPAGRCRRTPPPTAARWPAASPRRSVWL